MPRISAASLRFHRVLVSIRRISSRSAPRAAVREMSLRDTLPVAPPPEDRSDAATAARSMAAGADATALGALATAATAGGGMTGCSGWLVGRGTDPEVC